MPKNVEQWVLFQYIDGEVALLSKPFKTKQLAVESALEISREGAQEKWGRCDSDQIPEVKAGEAGQVSCLPFYSPFGESD